MGQGQSLMLYDGLCGFCNGAVRWVIRHDKSDRFRFAAQQSELATGILARCGVDRETMLKDNSVYLVLDAGSTQETLLTRSDVTVNMLLGLGGVWRVFGLALRAIPRFIRDAAYRVFARNRYRFTPQYAVCPVPSLAEREKFLG